MTHEKTQVKPEQHAAKTEKKTIAPSKARRGGIGSLFLSMTAIGVVCGLGYVNWQERLDMAKRMHTLQSRVATLTEQQTHATDDMHAMQAALEESKRQFHHVENQLQSMQQQSMYQSNDWMLMKARYYLELAQIHAQWGDNAQTTGDLLTQADRILQPIHDQRLLDVRRVIANEKASVLALPKVDVVGILTKLDADQALVSQLDVRTMTSPDKKPLSEQASTDAKATGWRARLQTSLHALETLVVVRHYDAEAQPLITPAFVALSREDLRLLLQEAQLAVLQHNKGLYRLVLQQAMKKINQSFDVQKATAQRLLSDLNDLVQVDVDQKKPSIGQALTALNQLIDSKQPDAKERSSQEPVAGEIAS